MENEQQNAGRPTMDPLTASNDIAQVAAALAQAQQEIEGASKDNVNPHFRSKYADLASVWEACRKALTKNGLAVTQVPSGEGRSVRLTTLLVHKSGQWIGGTSVMTATQDTPQAVGSCLTYLRRYSLAALVGVAPEDDDGNAASAKSPPPASRPSGKALTDAPRSTQVPTDDAGEVIGAGRLSADEDPGEAIDEITLATIRNEVTKRLKWKLDYARIWLRDFFGVNEPGDLTQMQGATAAALLAAHGTPTYNDLVKRFQSEGRIGGKAS